MFKFRQLKMLNQLYGATCNQPNVLAAKPTAATKIVRTIKDQADGVEDEWTKLDMNLFKDISVFQKVEAKKKEGAPTCEECRGPLHLPPAGHSKDIPKKEKNLNKKESPANVPGLPITQIPHTGPTYTEQVIIPEVPGSGGLDWRDPLITKVESMNPEEEDDEGAIIHNLAMV